MKRNCELEVREELRHGSVFHKSFAPMRVCSGNSDAIVFLVTNAIIGNA